MQGSDYLVGHWVGSAGRVVTGDLRGAETRTGSLLPVQPSRHSTLPIPTHKPLILKTHSNERLAKSFYHFSAAAVFPKLLTVNLNTNSEYE